MSHRTSTQRRTWKERALSLLLAAALMAGLAPGLTLSASAEHWADAYLDQLVDWGVMRADQTANPDADLTRAEFFAVINRAYGYTETGYIPFEDVLETDWFYDDIAIAYTAGYMAGTSPTTASPNDTLTREQAFCILGRNMMLKEVPGESLAFADSRDVSDWARGTIKAAADNYIVTGFPDNTLHPQDSISKGQMAVLISQCLGNPIRESGTYDLGGVFGNVTITAPNVTLRNATISGDLYISGGVGLGGIKLENVDVLGRIIVSGTGESEGGSASVIMRNVTAEEMLVDNMRNKTVTVRADGITDIARTVVRTNAYLEDNNTDDKGLMHIELDGDPGTRLTLAGRIKEVLDKTPSSYIQAAKGTVAKLTVDEAATNSTVQIDRNTRIGEVNLDVATSVLGDGDIGQLNINAPGSVVSMLPDKIYIRPGLTASIAGVIMDYQAAEEGSLDPRLLSGYPAAKDISPTGFRADFAGNKKGTIYWAVSSVSDGSIGEDDLISPPSYGSKAVANGSVAEPTGGDEVSAQVGNLVVGGSYYLSAILVDEQRERSPVKVISFSTPDNTIPDFGQGYPYMSRTTCSVAQVTVMPTKSCKLYYALLPQGARAPTANEMKAAAVTGNLGYGVRDVTRNTEDVFTVNSQRLEELKTYVLYLWLSDVDGANSSAIQSLSFTIPDETPPVVDPIPYSVSQGTTGNTIAMRSGMNEQGTIYWAVVPHGENYPLPNMAEPLGPDNVVVDGDAVSAKLDSMYAKLGVQGGRGALISGSVAVNNPDTEVSFNVTGLLPETAYDLYYVGRDSAGNYSTEVKMVTINTQDTSGPIVTLYFINPDKSTTEATGLPPANASIVLDFSELITVNSTTDLLSMDKGLLTERLQLNFVLHQLDPMNPSKEMEIIDITGLPITAEAGVDSKTSKKAQAIEDGNTWIDYDNVTVRQSSSEQGHIEVVFEYDKAISMRSGRTYYFSLGGVWENNLGIRDTSGNYPPKPNGEEIKIPLTPTSTANTDHVLPRFTTSFASVALNNTGSLPDPVWAGALKGLADDAPDSAKDGIGKRTNRNGVEYQPTRMDTFFTVTPESTAGITDETFYDIVLFADKAVGYDLYYRMVDTTNRNTPLTKDDPADSELGDSKFNYYKLPSKNEADPKEDNGWIYLGNYSSSVSRNSGKAVSAVNTNFIRVDMDYPPLNKLGEGLRYDFAISITSIDSDPRYAAWNGEVNFDVYIMAGAANALNGAIFSSIRPEEYSGRGLQSIGVPNPPGYVTATAYFTDSIKPAFTSGWPTFDENVTSATLKFALDPSPSTLYYRIAPVDQPITPVTLKLYNNDGNTAAGNLDITDSAGNYLTTVDSTDTENFYKVIKAQTDLKTAADRTLRGTQGTLIPDDDEGHLRYYKVDDGAAKTLRKNIANMDAYRDYWPGTEPYDDVGEISPRIPSQNSAKQLEPEKDYYIYIVLEGASGNQDSLSQVYIYTFRTSASAKPRFTTMFPKNNEGTVDVATDVASVMTYMLFPETQLPSILGQTFSAAADVPSRYNVSTVLDALVETYQGGDENYDTEWYGRTIFDIYASTTEKEDVDLMIFDRQKLDVEPAKYEKQQTVPAAPSNRNFDWFTDNSNVTTNPNNPPQYVFVAIAHNRDSDTDDPTILPTIDSFRAIRGVYKTDLTAPVLRTASASIIPGTPTNQTRDGTYTVRVTLGFNKNLHYLDENGNGPNPVLSIAARGSYSTTTMIGTITTDPDSVYTGANMSHTVVLSGVGAGTVTLLANYTICEEYGSGTTDYQIEIEISEVPATEENEGSLISYKIGRVDVYFRNQNATAFHQAWTEEGRVQNP